MAPKHNLKNKNKKKENSKEKLSSHTQLKMSNDRKITTTDS